MEFKGIFSVWLMLLLVGCSGDNGDLIAFIDMTKSEHVARIPPLKSPPKLEHFEYQAELLRSPFGAPSRELVEDKIDFNQNCFQPSSHRSKSIIETYALDTLTMRGTLQQDEQIWALIQTANKNVYRLGIGDYLGLYHGRITQITPSQLDIIEMIPDGLGCWIERTSTMELIGTLRGENGVF